MTSASTKTFLKLMPNYACSRLALLKDLKTGQNVPVLIFGEFFDNALLLQLGEDGVVLLLGAVADVEGVGLAQSNVGLHKLSDSWAEGAQVTLQDSGAILVLGLKLRRHGVEESGERESK